MSMILNTPNYAVEVSSLEEHIIPLWVMNGFGYLAPGLQAGVFGRTKIAKAFIKAQDEGADGHDWQSSHYYDGDLLDLVNNRGSDERTIVLRERRGSVDCYTVGPPMVNDRLLMFLQETPQHSLKVVLATVSGPAEIHDHVKKELDDFRALRTFD